jgi:hypothetical protein
MYSVAFDSARRIVNDTLQFIMHLASLVLVLLCLTSSGGAQTRDFSANGQFFPGEYTTAKAMERAYGGFDSKSMSSVWTPSQSPVYEERWPDQIRVHPLKDFAYIQGGVPRHLLVTWSKPDETAMEEYSCHACGVLLGVVAFEKVEGGWKVEASNLQLAVGGASGHPPEAKLLRLGNSTFGFALQVGDIHGGELTEGLEMYGPLSGTFTEWFVTELEDLDPEHDFDETCRGLSEGEMDGTCVWYRKTYSMAPRRGYEMYDLLVRRRVVRSFSKKTPVGTTVQHFRFDGKKYVALKRVD